MIPPGRNPDRQKSALIAPAQRSHSLNQSTEGQNSQTTELEYRHIHCRPNPERPDAARNSKLHFLPPFVPLTCRIWSSCARNCRKLPVIGADCETIAGLQDSLFEIRKRIRRRSCSGKRESAEVLSRVGRHSLGEVSATTAPRRPFGRLRPAVVSRSVWCSSSAFSSAPRRTMKADSQSQVIRMMTPASAP